MKLVRFLVLNWKEDFDVGVFARLEGFWGSEKTRLTWCIFFLLLCSQAADELDLLASPRSNLPRDAHVFLTIFRFFLSESIRGNVRHTREGLMLLLGPLADKEPPTTLQDSAGLVSFLWRREMIDWSRVFCASSPAYPTSPSRCPPPGWSLFDVSGLFRVRVFVGGAWRRPQRLAVCPGLCLDEIF